MSEVLRVNSLGHAFGETKVLEGVSFVLDQGERLGVLGRSGSGKTTLLRLIAGLESPTEGDIAIAGKAASRAGRVLIAPERRGVALVFQGLALFPNLRALDQIAFAARGRGGIEQARRLLDRVGLRHRADARLDELSGGERQRIALARALAQEPRLILMDEPFASLDDEKRAEMRDLLRSLLERTETTLVLVTHSRDDAFDLARRAIVFDHGRPVADDLLETLSIRPRHAAAVRALGLGELIPGVVTAQGDAETAFGMVRTTPGTRPGPALLLVRPDQPHLAADGTGVEAEVLSLELRPPEGREVRRVAVVRASGNVLRVFARECTLSAGERVRVRIEGECDPVQGV
ncbi:iron(III) transport system ATP-binding protein/putative spermidine/putrescine transport system ATP-binding protein [Singulisphaera sp. GP187]|uniref:ABC transporter ATP-binding protein n=1 Tax=Singulisphaera sp. GP187 TaxID=1882752 RepID=UPI000929FAAB|nr:ATP-binding cassette domain-containing protein [Singulisphaera sp. GP187]SIN77311.1 iron(III) transport system ATP-binding protein/putative spermidine/putrescine transport system ATP-binding protein [Singulisphaera sp. GP187]